MRRVCLSQSLFRHFRSCGVAVQRFKSVDAEFVQLMRRVAHKPNIMEVQYCRFCRVRLLLSSSIGALQ